MNREAIRTATGITIDAALPCYFFLAWIAPFAQPADTQGSLLVALLGENLVLFFTAILAPLAAWRFRDWIGAISLFGLVALVASVALNSGLFATAAAALLVLGRFAILVFRGSADVSDFPATPRQALVALALFWSVLLLVALASDYGMLPGGSDDVFQRLLAAHGSLYFSMIIGVRIARLAGRSRQVTPVAD